MASNIPKALIPCINKIAVLDYSAKVNSSFYGIHQELRISSRYMFREDVPKQTQDALWERFETAFSTIMALGYAPAHDTMSNVLDKR